MSNTVAGIKISSFATKDNKRIVLVLPEMLKGTYGDKVDSMMKIII